MTVGGQNNDAENGDNANRVELTNGRAGWSEIQKLPSELVASATSSSPPLVPTAPGEDVGALPSKSPSIQRPMNTKYDASILVSSAWSELRDDVENELKWKDPNQDESLDEKEQELNVKSKHHSSGNTPSEDDPHSGSDQSKISSVEGTPEKRRGIKRFCGKSFNRFADRYPRVYALFFGFFGPILFLVVLAALCGYPLALLESPLEMDRNDKRLASQMRLLVETALYSNVTQSLPRVCLQLFMMNASPGEFLDNVTELMENPPTVLKNVTVNQTALDDAVNFNNTTNSSAEHHFIIVQNGTLQIDNSTLIVMNETSQRAEAIANLAEVDDDVLQDDDFGVILNGSAADVRAENEFDAELILITGPFQNYFQYDSFLSGLNNNAPANETKTFNVDEMSNYVLDCGHALGPLVDRMFLSLSNTSRGIYADPITFAWSRCPAKRSDEHLKLDPLVSFLDSIFIDNVAINWTYEADSMESSVQAQANHYRENWEKDRRRLYLQYLSEDSVSRYVNASFVPTLWQRFDAFERSITDATGREGCFPNIPASCWFWFTVMTTIGYGNSSPESHGGRAMVFTLGFAAIILFGASSSRAGTVICALLEDFAIRVRLLFLNRPWVACLTWAALYYVWMVAIGVYYVAWLKDRLKKTEPLGIGYWFAYVSSTTVGFGDYYLPPAVISAGDCIVYPLMFMFSFTLLANFLTKLAAILGGQFLDGSHLVQQFHNMDDIKNAEDLGNLPRPSK